MKPIIQLGNTPTTVALSLSPSHTPTLKPSNGETLRVVLDENIEKLNDFTDKSKKTNL